MPPSNLTSAPPHSVPEFAQNYLNLASPRLGAKVLYASDDFFADKDRLIVDAPPSFDPNLYDSNGKYMDGWETRRRRQGGHDYCIIKLGAASYLHGVDIDTSFFTGNYPPAASLEACFLDDDDDAPRDMDWSSLPFEPILPAVALGASAHHWHALGAAPSRKAYTHVRLSIYPDGGVARLRLYGTPAPVNFARGVEHEFSLTTYGAKILGFNDAHYGAVWTLLTEGRGLNMGDGWETRRRREPGYDWIVIQLAAPCLISRVILDTCHYKGNFPDAFALHGALLNDLPKMAVIADAQFWPELLAREPLCADAIHSYGAEKILIKTPVSHVRLSIFPDGGVSRLRIFGHTP